MGIFAILIFINLAEYIDSFLSYNFSISEIEASIKLIHLSLLYNIP